MTRAIAMILALLLLLSACGGADGGTAGETAGETGGETGDAAGDPETEEGASDNPWENFTSPIASMLGFDREPSDDQEAEFAERERQAQEQIRQCMAAEGFEYQPVDQSQFVVFGEGEDLSIEERVAQYGYGYSTYLDDEAAFAEPDFVDPNQEYVESLEPAEQEAYYRALYGDSPDIDPSLSEEEINEIFEDFVPTGCEPTAYETVYNTGPEQSFYTTFQDELEEMYQRVESDPRITAEREQWSACMAEAGYPFAGQEDIFMELDQRMQPVWESQEFPGGDLTEEEMEALSEEELEAIFRQPPVFDQELLAQVREYELAVAAADFSCPGTSFLPSEAYFDVLAEYEQAFIDQNADRIREVVPDAEF